MKAIFFEKHGGPEVLKYGDIPKPKVKPGHALIRVEACALNHLDIWVRKGWNGLNLELPHIGGSDVVGEIVELNSKKSQWSVGTRVAVNPGIVTGEDEWTRRGEDSVSPGYRIIGEQLPGGFAEYISVPLTNVFRIPDHVTYPEAAASILVGTTCWRMLLKRAGLQAGQTVLVVGAGGGVNSLAIKLAEKFGATVYALTSSDEKMKRAQELGATEVINYREQRHWAKEILRLTKGRGVDLVVDNVGKATFAQSIRAVCRGGSIVTVGNTSGHELTLDNRLVFTKQVSLIGSTMGSRQDFMDAMRFLWTHNIYPPIDRVAPLSEGIQMLRYLEEGEQFGKIVLSPTAESVH
ncbi:MAG: zinc-binding dehydrogenase [Bdellovibrionales bacterium]|nr:zinc-binding dehydrogenase [Bdellovibrionales bacterium]